MYYRYFLIFILLLSVTGCATTYKSRTKTAIPIALREKLSTDDKDKVWIEAETKKVWVNSHVDENGDMVEGHYKHIIVNQGHWAVKEGGKEQN